MSSDKKNSSNKDESFDLLAHEKIISEIYHDKEQQTEEPSAQIDSAIMAMAQKQLKDNPSSLIEEQKRNHRSIQIRTKKTWQWPFSLVASVGILGLLFITQRDYFIHPNNIASEDAGTLNEPAMLAPDMSKTETFTEELVTKRSFQEMKMAVSSQKAEVLVDKEITAMARKRLPVMQAPNVLKEQMLDSLMLEDNSAKISPMSLLELSKLAESLKLALSEQTKTDVIASASSLKMQQTLFEHLLQYKKNHADFEITEKYSSLLTDRQVQKLKSKAIEAVTEN